MGGSPATGGRQDGGAPRAWMLIPPSAERFDGIRDFASNLASSLAPAQQVHCLTTAGDQGRRETVTVLTDWRGLRERRDRPDVIYVNYLPPAWLRRDTPHLLATLSRLRAAGARVILIIHEYQVDSDGSLRRGAVRALFRALARAFVSRADAIVVTHSLIERRFERDRIGRGRRIALVPIGSNVSPPPGEPAFSAGAATGPVVMFGQPASMDPLLVGAVARALVEDGRAPLRWICRDAAELARWLAAAGIPDAHVVVLAGLAPDHASREMREARLALAPFVDGVSTRRSTVSAFLAHGLPVAGVSGPATDDVLARSGAFALTTRDDVAGMVASVRALASDDARCRAMSAAGARLFEARLAWPRIAADYLRLTA